jgi:hypothetical protein
MLYSVIPCTVLNRKMAVDYELSMKLSCLFKAQFWHFQESCGTCQSDYWVLVMHLGPLRGVPVDGAVQHVAVLAIDRRWLWAHVVRHNDSVGAASRDLMNTVHLTGLEAHATGLGAWLEVGVVPSWWTRVVIARSD